MNLVVKMSSIKKAMVFCFLILYFVFGIMVSFNSLGLSERISNKPICVCLIIFLILMIWGNAKIKSRSSYYVCILIFGFSNIVSSIFNGSSVLFWCAIFGMLAITFARCTNLGTAETTYKTLFLPYVISGFVAMHRYMSSFNSQGVVYAFIGVILLNILCIKKKGSIILYLGVVFGEIFLLSITRSRTSMMVFLVVAVISFAYLFMKKVSLKNIIFSLALFILLLVTYDKIYDFFYRIFFQKWGNTDITSKRLSIWIDILERAKMFGNGSTYMDGFDAHNTFMQVLDMFGYFSLCLIIMAVILILISISRASNSIIYVNFFVAWLGISMFENLDIFTTRLLPITLLFILHVTLLSNEISNKKGNIGIKHKELEAINKGLKKHEYKN